MTKATKNFCTTRGAHHATPSDVHRLSKVIGFVASGEFTRAIWNKHEANEHPHPRAPEASGPLLRCGPENGSLGCLVFASLHVGLGPVPSGGFGPWTPCLRLSILPIHVGGPINVPLWTAAMSKISSRVFSCDNAFMLWAIVQAGMVSRCRKTFFLILCDLKCGRWPSIHPIKRGCWPEGGTQVSCCKKTGIFSENPRTQGKRGLKQTKTQAQQPKDSESSLVKMKFGCVALWMPLPQILSNTYQQHACSASWKLLPRDHEV